MSQEAKSNSEPGAPSNMYTYKGSSFGINFGNKPKPKASIPTNPLNPWFLSRGDNYRNCLT
jgi:hypothetical protein